MCGQTENTIEIDTLQDGAIAGRTSPIRLWKSLKRLSLEKFLVVDFLKVLVSKDLQMRREEILDHLKEKD